MEIKKVGGGTYANSPISVATGYYTEHIEPFKGLIEEQINLIDPTVIICLGRECGCCTSQLLAEIKENVGKRIWIDGYHHQFSSNEKFYYGPLNEYKKIIKSKIE